MTKTSRSHNSSAQTLSEVSLIVFVRPVDQRTLISTESNLSTSPRLRRRISTVFFCFPGVDAVRRRRVYNSRKKKHQELKNHGGHFTRNISTRRSLKCFHVVCVLFTWCELVFRLKLPGCKYHLGTRVDGLKNCEQAVSGCGNSHRTWTQHKHCTYDFLLDLMSNYCPLWFYLSFQEAWALTLPSWIRCRPYLFLWILACLSVCVRVCARASGGGLCM